MQESLSGSNEYTAGLPVSICNTSTGEKRNLQSFELRDLDANVVGRYTLAWHRPVRTYPDGRTKLVREFGLFSIGAISIDKSLQGRETEDGQRVPGLGRDLYRYIATQSAPPDGLPDDGLPYYLTAKDRDLNDISRAMWEGFVARGEAQMLDDGSVYYVYGTPTVQRKDILQSSAA